MKRKWHTPFLVSGFALLAILLFSFAGGEKENFETKSEKSPYFFEEEIRSEEVSSSQEALVFFWGASAFLLCAYPLLYRRFHRKQRGISDMQELFFLEAQAGWHHGGTWIFWFFAVLSCGFGYLSLLNIGYIFAVSAVSYLLSPELFVKSVRVPYGFLAKDHH